MNLLQVRDKFRDLSGRHDLVEGDATKTADFLINSASQFLDRLTETQKTPGHTYKFLYPEGWNVSFQQCRAIKEVWVSSTHVRWELEKQSLDWMIGELMMKSVSELREGPPIFYAPLYTRTIDIVPTGYADYVNSIISLPNLFNAILILPPPDIQLLIDIVGFFYSDKLVKDTDVNFWTVTNPNILIKAIFRELRAFEEDHERVASWEKAIAADLDGLNKDLVEEMIADVDQMEG